MERRKIRLIESTSVGKKSGKNDDDIYVGENFVAVIDGVSNKSTINENGKRIKISEIITEALRKIDRPTAPVYAKTLEFAEFVKHMNMYISKYCQSIQHDLVSNPLEATGVFYSKYHNQIWLVGDCRAIYDGNEITNDLKIDEVYSEIRTEIVKTLLRLGYKQKELFANNIEKDIIANQELISQYIKDENEAKGIRRYIQDIMYRTLLECGFSEEEINNKNLLEKYPNPRILQQYLKNNPNVGEYGYSVLNGINTELKNCKVKTLPKDVKRITLSSDGIPMNILKKSQNMGQTIRGVWSLAKKDPLSINENRGVKSAMLQSRRSSHLAFDDFSSICIEIEYENERDEER